jgi:hypothetical protein
MNNYFSERKLVFFSTSGPEASKSDFEEIGKSFAENEVGNINESRQITDEQGNIRDQLENFDLFTDEDKERWKKRLDNAGHSKSETEKIRRELNAEQEEVKKMVSDYTGAVDKNLKNAFTKESADEFKKEFPEQSTENKRIWYKKLNDEIKVRIDLRDELLDLYPEIVPDEEKKTVKEQIYQLRRHEMAEKVAEFRDRRQNIQEYTKRIQKDREHFSDKSFSEFITEFIKLKSTDEQREWISGYEKQAQKRRELTRNFKQFSNARQQKHKNFWQLSRHEKVEQINKMEQELEEEFRSELRKYPDAPKQTKRRYENYFSQIDIKNKEYAISHIREWLENDQRYEREYSRMPDELLKLPRYGKDVWEKTPFDDKEQFLRDMNHEWEQLKQADVLLDKELKAKTITKNTRNVYRKKFLRMTIAQKVVSLEQFESGIKRRRDDVEQFSGLSKDTQRKFAKFWKGERYAERHAILIKALEYEAEKQADSAKEKPGKENNEEKQKNPFEKTQKLSEKMKEQISMLQSQAESLEKQGQADQAIGMHKAVLLIDSKNPVSIEKIKILERKNDEDEKWKDENLIQSLVTEAALTQPMVEERENIQIAGEFVAQQEEVEHTTNSSEMKNQQSHLDDVYAEGVDEAVLKHTKGKKRIGRDGKLKDVERFDTEWLGLGDKSEKLHFKDVLRNKKPDEPLENLQVIDEHGNEKNVDYAKQKLKEREKRFRDDLSKKARKRIKSKDKTANDEDIIPAVEDAAEEEDISINLTG